MNILQSTYCLLLFTAWTCLSFAQTPYDSFAPEATRPMLEVEALYPNVESQTDLAAADTILCVAVIDLQRKVLMLVDLRSNTILGAAPLTDELQKWLSVDPLADKNISTSPYMYCNGNPMAFVDPDGGDAIYIAFPQYKANGYPLTGHAGVLLIDNKTGLTKYYEYGRYNGALGKTRNIKVPDVELANGRPSLESLSRVLKAISIKAGHGGDIKGAYVISDKFNEMNKYATDRIAENNDPNRTPYNFLYNNCATFAEDVINQDESVDKPWIVIHSPVNTVDEYQEEGNAAIYYDSKTDKVYMGKGNETDAKKANNNEGF